MGKMIWGTEIEARAGMAFITDESPNTRILQDCEIPEFATFRAQSWVNPNIPAVACEIEITGRTIQRKRSSRAVRCKITWVKDCEPNEATRGWLFIDSTS